MGVPVALIGLLGYIAILGSLLVPENETSRLATVAFTVVGFGFSAYLTYRELFSIHHICEYCVSSAVIVTILMCLADVALPARRSAIPTLPGRSGSERPARPPRRSARHDR